MARIVISPAAESDLVKIFEWYDGQRPGLADQFREHLSTTLDQIAERPYRFTQIGKRMRRSRLSRFPYYVTYHVLDDVIRVIAVVHTSRHPRHWKRRK